MASDNTITATLDHVTESIVVDPWESVERVHADGSVVVNDVHSRLNATTVESIVRPRSVEEAVAAVRSAKARGIPIAIAGARHAMGGQQFAAGAVLLDMSRLKRVVDFDESAGSVTVEAGCDWVDLTNHLIEAQKGREAQWSIVQKQTGADRLTLGGCVGANIHGRGLKFRPFVQDIESLTLIDAEGELTTCDRSTNEELFRLAIGGYGLFGVVCEVKLRLQRRFKVERLATQVHVGDLISEIDRHAANGCEYGDLQMNIDDAGEDFLTRGILSCYRTAPNDTPIPVGQKYIPQAQLERLIGMAHTDKAAAYRHYSDYYAGSSGQIYWSDTHQFGFYPYGYHAAIDRQAGAPSEGSEMITELYVPRAAIAEFMTAVAADLRSNGESIIYSTIRFIEVDGETFLPWAKQRNACIIFNVHVDHSQAGIERAAGTFRRLIDQAIRLGGSFYLTYHRFATREQILACYPQLPELLRRKLHFDPEERFQSEWYRHYRGMFADHLQAGRQLNSGSASMVRPREPLIRPG